MRKILSCAVNIIYAITIGIPVGVPLIVTGYVISAAADVVTGEKLNDGCLRAYHNGVKCGLDCALV